MKLIFAGTPESARDILQMLMESGEHDVVATLTQPDKSSGRGRKLTPPPVKVLSESCNIPVYQPHTLKEDETLPATLRAYDADIFVVVAYGKILPPELLSIPRYGCVNIHFSLLPKYRGAAPIQWAIINCETSSGVTLIKMNERMDEGDILAQETVDILEDDDTVSVTNFMSCIGVQLLLTVLKKVEETGELKGTPQNHSIATYAPRLTKADGYLEWTLDTTSIICRIKGLYPWPCALTFLKGMMIKILRAEPPASYDQAQLPHTQTEKIKPGTVVALSKERGIFVRTGDGFLLITKLQPENKREMSGVDFINGGYVKIGSRFEKPQGKNSG